MAGNGGKTAGCSGVVVSQLATIDVAGAARRSITNQCLLWRRRSAHLRRLRNSSGSGSGSGGGVALK